MGYPQITQISISLVLRYSKERGQARLPDPETVACAIDPILRAIYAHLRLQMDQLEVRKAGLPPL